MWRHPRADTGSEAGLTAVIVDVVTGRTLHHQHHRGGRGPVAAAVYDNTAVLQFWDTQAFRWHVSVMELYEHAVAMPSTGRMIAGARAAQSALRVRAHSAAALTTLPRRRCCHGHADAGAQRECARARNARGAAAELLQPRGRAEHRADHHAAQRHTQAPPHGHRHGPGAACAALCRSTVGL